MMLLPVTFHRVISGLDPRKLPSLTAKPLVFVAGDRQPEGISMWRLPLRGDGRFAAGPE
jgi:hypothetical protein